MGKYFNFILIVYILLNIQLTKFRFFTCGISSPRTAKLGYEKDIVLAFFSSILRKIIQIKKKNFSCYI